MDVTTLGSRIRFLVTGVQRCRSQYTEHSKIFSIFETEPNVFLRGTTECGFLQVWRTELNNLICLSFCTQICSEQFEIPKEYNKAKHSSYSVVLLQFKFKLEYQNEKMPKYLHVHLSYLELS